MFHDFLEIRLKEGTAYSIHYFAIRFCTSLTLKLKLRFGLCLDTSDIYFSSNFDTFKVTYTSDSIVKMYVCNDSIAIHFTGSLPWKINKKIVTELLSFLLLGN